MRLRTPRTKDLVRDLLARGMTEYQRKLHLRLIERVEKAFLVKRRENQQAARRAARQVPRHLREKWRKDLQGDRRRPENSIYRELADFLRQWIRLQIREVQEWNDRQKEFRKQLSRAIHADESRRILLDHAALFQQHVWQAWGDYQASFRWLNDEAIHDRFDRRRGEAEQLLAFCFDRLGHVVGYLSGLVPRGIATVQMWERLGIVSLVYDAMEASLDLRVHRAALEGLRQALVEVTSTDAQAIVHTEAQMMLERLALDVQSDVWLQCSAIQVLRRVSPTFARQTIRHRLMSPDTGDDLFVRRACVRWISEEWEHWRDDRSLCEKIVHDPNASVRQQWAMSLWTAPQDVIERTLPALVQNENTPAVRAAAYVGRIENRRRDVNWRWLGAWLAQVLRDETDDFAARAAIQGMMDWVASEDPRGRAVLRDLTLEQRRSLKGDLVPALEHVMATRESVLLRRAAAAARELIACAMHANTRAAYERLVPRIDQVPWGTSRWIARKEFQDVPRDVLGRVLAVITQDDFGVDVEETVWGYRVSRAPRLGWRLWRTLFEFRHPATDKRQAYRHTVGRVSRATLRAPSRVLGELSQTKVPGEPLVIAEEGNWRPFLPLPDDFVSSLNVSWLWPRTVRFFSSEGITEITPSTNPIRRIVAAYHLATRFADLAELRNWQSRSTRRPDKYLEAMRGLGFQIVFREHSVLETPADQPSPILDRTVWQFFPAGVVLWPAWRNRIWTVVNDYAYYFHSSFENTLDQLVLFAAVALTAFIGRHATQNLLIHAARKSIPLSLGGWGTRGKSGTERLKAALITGRGHGLLSKTTGCEAMFIQAFAHGTPLEIPLYRPNDKATIWEHANLIRFAARLRPHVFLWECMGLTPAYVDVLQRQWTQDDLVTITNAYPDHEDVQGPSGYDVATTIAGFVPVHARVVTTERQMRPLLREACRQRKTSLRAVEWLDAGLITDDLLARFPYREHPDNIALVTAMADELGVPRDVAYKDMADFLVPDLGVLKTHPVALVDTRRIEFSNGMSANERFGCLGNWRRLDFERYEPDLEPLRWVSTVVNNRADRVARSRVFADVVVSDLSADRHFLIGGNLKGLQGFIHEAWQVYVERVSLIQEGNAWSPSAAREILESLARRFRIMTSRARIVRATSGMLEGLCPTLDVTAREALVEACVEAASVESLQTLLTPHAVTPARISSLFRFLHEWKQGCDEYQTLRSAIDQAHGPQIPEGLDQRVRDTLGTWFQRKIVVIENYYATGDEVIQTIVDHTPFGFTNRVMGIQNIKGTGLDFVYRFHAWDLVYQACQWLQSRDAETRRRGLDWFHSQPQVGLLGRDTVRNTLESLRHAQPVLPAEQVQTVEHLLQQLQTTNESQNVDVVQTKKTTESWWKRLAQSLAGVAEQFLEIHDAVRRRRAADQVYRDLATGRIGRLRAVQELRKLNKRQKGGWLLHGDKSDDDGGH